MAGSRPSSGVGGLSANLISVFGWSMIPSFLTSAILTLFYRFFPSSRPTVPPRAAPQHVAAANARAQRHYRRVRITLIAAYLAYSVLSIYWSQARGAEQNYYTLLDLSRDLVDRDGASVVKSHWRRLARVYHPDKVGKEGEAFFVLLRRGVEVLEDENKRLAYERFGPGVQEWGDKLVTKREFLAKGTLYAGIFWGFAFGSIAVFTFFRKSERRYNFWRYLSLALCLSLEFHLLFRSSPSPTFSFVFPHRLPYQHIALLRQLFISTSMAMSQLGPLLFPETPTHFAAASPASSEAEQYARAVADVDSLKPLIERLMRVTAQAELEASVLQSLELRPLMESVKPDPDVPGVEERKVIRKLVDGMVAAWEDSQLKNNPRTARAWDEALRRPAQKAAREKEPTKEDADKDEVVEEVEVEEDDEADARSEASASTAAGYDVASSDEAESATASTNAVDDTPLSLDSAVIPPPVTLLASPPTSPRTGSADLAIPLPVLEAVMREVGGGANEPAGLTVRGKKDAEGEKGEMAKRDGTGLQLSAEQLDARLPTPPPDE
ncbi:Chaperone DNAJ [Rhodotorula toruloides ATCC 204091]|uniref:Chaperone DNAJ n=1 Tax=Rhodotorula toruloides TaxID=5286 RepID=A0A0K3CJA8_RHOTO|nr:Chaperone DNAJ [Rhodotorula toruloides ATCC 204091]KAK4332344.1 Chaperone DNAJ [Rhodotorula toruloides]PRQ72615.1 chaperone DNAJ [Rhodotorula toruloides]